MSAMRNSNYYEVALVGPDCPNMIAPVYKCGYTDQLDCIGKDGCVAVPTGPGLGVQYDWDYIRAHQVAEIADHRADEAGDRVVVIGVHGRRARRRARAR